MNEWDWIKANDIYSTRTIANDIVKGIFSRFNMKWPRMNGKISFMTVNDWYNPFSFALCRLSVMRFSKTISSC